MSIPHRNAADDLNALQFVAQQNHVYTKSADATLNEGGGVFILGSGVDVVLPAPETGMRFRFHCPDSTADATVTTSGTGVTFDGTNDKATLSADADMLEIVAMSSTRWHIIEATATTVTYSDTDA